ncbi:MAG: hypothetical protein QM648_10075 [Solirubrobacterales bacterium]
MQKTKTSAQRVSRAIFAVGAIAAVVALLFLGAYYYGQHKYHECLTADDVTYPQGGSDTPWLPSFNAAAKACADKNFLPESWLG